MSAAQGSQMIIVLLLITPSILIALSSIVRLGQDNDKCTDLLRFHIGQLLMHRFDVHSSTSLKHLALQYPRGHLHLKPITISVNTPPFARGSKAHSFMFILQWIPVKLGKHWHVAGLIISSNSFEMHLQLVLIELKSDSFTLVKLRKACSFFMRSLSLGGYKRHESESMTSASTFTSIKSKIVGGCGPF